MQIGSYQVTSELARGGMGVVYRARGRDGRQVVIKLLKLEAPTSKARLQREARAMRKLDHPHVVGLIDAGEQGGLPFLVLPYVEGESLDALLEREGQLPLPEALRIAEQVAAGLGAAHAAGLVHRDVKPANVLLDPRGNALLTDFGLVKDLGRRSSDGQEVQSLSLTTAFLGTPGYWPPEQAFPGRGQIGPAADVYALGATLYAMLGGRPPRPGTTLIEALSAFERPIPALARLRPKLPLWVYALVRACLEDDPERRPSLASVRAELANPSRRRGALVWAAGAAGLAVAVALAVGGSRVVTSSSGEPRRVPVEDAPPGDEAQLGPELALEHLRRGQAEVEGGRYGAALPHLDRALAHDPQSAPGLVSRAAAYAGLGRHEDALRDLDRTLNLEPRQAEAHAARARSLATLERHEQALKASERALQLEPTLRAALLSRAQAYRDLARYDAALDDVARLQAHDPDDVNVLRLQGSVLARAGRWDEALLVYQRTTTLEPSVESWGALGVALAANSHLEKAHEAFDYALTLDPDHCAVRLDRAYLRVKLGRLLDALADCERVLALEPERPLAHAHRAVVLVRLKRYPEALESADHALRLDPGNSETWQTRASALHRLKRWEESAAAYRRAFELGARSSVSRANLGWALAHLGRFEETERACDEALKLNPRNDYAYANRAWARGRLGRMQGALDDADAALAARPGNPWAHAHRALALVGLDRPEEALAAAERALKVGPGLALGHERRARALSALGRRPEARAAVLRALELGLPPGEHEPARALARELE